MYQNCDFETNIFTYYVINMESSDVSGNLFYELLCILQPIITKKMSIRIKYMFVLMLMTAVVRKETGDQGIVCLPTDCAFVPWIVFGCHKMVRNAENEGIYRHKMVMSIK